MYIQLLIIILCVNKGDRTRDEEFEAECDLWNSAGQDQTVMYHLFNGISHFIVKKITEFSFQG